jgi:hypothetical protein
MTKVKISLIQVNFKLILQYKIKEIKISTAMILYRADALGKRMSERLQD